MAKKQTLDQWIQEAITDPDKEGPCTMLACVHKVGTNEEEIHSLKVSATKPWEPKELASLFKNKAQHYCQEIPGVQTFNLLAFYGSRTEAQARHLFVLNGELDFGGLATEGPTGSGLLQQMMRHTEALMQTTIKATAELVGRTTAVMDSLTKENQRLMLESADSFAIVRDMMMEKVTVEARMLTNVEEVRRESEERKLLIKLFPPLLNVITGQEVFPQSVADTSLLESIADSISEEDFAKLGNILPAAQMAPLAARFADVLKKKREAKQLTQGDTVESELQ